MQREKERKREKDFEKTSRKTDGESEKPNADARFTHPTSRSRACTHAHASTVREKRAHDLNTRARRHFNTRHSCCRAPGWFSWQRGWVLSPLHKGAGLVATTTTTMTVSDDLAHSARNSKCRDIRLQYAMFIPTSSGRLYATSSSRRLQRILTGEGIS